MTPLFPTVSPGAAGRTIPARDLGYLLIRLALGVNILAHALARTGGNYDKFVAWAGGLFAATPLPAWAVGAFARAVPPAEGAIGLLLLLGLFTSWAAVAGGLLMIALIFGMAMVQNWEIVGVQMIYVAFYAALVALADHDRFSLDRLRHARPGR